MWYPSCLVISRFWSLIPHTSAVYINKNVKWLVQNWSFCEYKSSFRLLLASLISIFAVFITKLFLIWNFNKWFLEILLDYWFSCCFLRPSVTLGKRYWVSLVWSTVAKSMLYLYLFTSTFCSKAQFSDFSGQPFMAMWIPPCLPLWGWLQQLCRVMVLFLYSQVSEVRK